MTIPGLRYLGALAGLLILGCRDALFGACAIIFDYHNHPTKWWWGSELPQVRTTFYTSAAALGMLFVQSRRFPVAAVLKSRIFIALAVFYLLMLVRLSPYDPAEHARWMDKDFKSILVAILLACTVRTTGRARLLMWVLVIGCWGLGIEAWRNPRRSAGRLYGVGVPDAFSENMFASHLALTVPFLIDRVLRGERWEKVLAVLGGAFIANAIILTSSRGGFLAAVAAAGFYLCGSLRDRKTRRYAIGIALVGFIGSASLVDEVFLERIQTLLGEENPWTGQVEATTGAGRTDVWKHSLPMLGDYPMGLGAGGFRLRSPDYMPAELWSFDAARGRAAKSAHNTFLLVAVDFGWAAFIAFVVLLLITARFLWRVWRGSDGEEPDLDRSRHGLVLAAMLGSLIVSFMFVDRVHYDWFFAVIGLAIGLTVWKRDSEVDPYVPGPPGVHVDDADHVAGIRIKTVVIGLAASLVMLL